uniref:Uncharacterized protein n=1 Tax=Myoviridae sp. ctDvB7 TaxID=2825057 RepID=A0A8S5UEQ1_9CAUD|nr:MAG TPA: hypothetical protein [Myoviridae sp. ctDvB7]
MAVQVFAYVLFLNANTKNLRSFYGLKNAV